MMQRIIIGACFGLMSLVACQSKKKEEPKTKTETPTAKPVETNITNQRKDNTELKNAQKKFQKIEQELEQLKSQKEAVELDLANPGIYKTPDKFAATEKNYQQIQQRLAIVENEYEQLFEKIMELENS